MENNDLRGMLLSLYVKNNPKMLHQIFIYSFNGITDVRTNPFQYVSGDLPPNVKKVWCCKTLPVAR